MWHPSVICITNQRTLSSAKVQDLIGDKEYSEHIFISDSLFRQIRHTTISVSLTVLAIKIPLTDAAPSSNSFLPI